MSLIPIEAKIDNRDTLGGGLNSTAGPLHLQENESSDLQNIDFDKFGSVLKRGGYYPIAPLALSGNTVSDGLWWYEYNNSGVLTRYVICINNGKTYSMPESLAGTWTEITGATATAGNHFDFDNFLNVVIATNSYDRPFYWSGTGTTTNFAALQANSFTFDVTGITTPPTVGAIYSNSSYTFTVTQASLVSDTTYSGVLVTTGTPTPLSFGTIGKASGTGDSNINYAAVTVNANIQKAKLVKQYNNYLFFGDVTIGTTRYPSRIYWSNIKNINSWSATNWIDVSKDDGQEITGMSVLQDRLVIFKSRSIYNLFFTGDSDIPFVLPGGGKSNSNVGCVAQDSIAGVENGLVFLASDGFYYYDGSSSTKISDKITSTLMGYSTTKFDKCVSCVYKKKNFVYFSLASTGSTNDTLVVWNYFLNAWSIYKGIAAADMVIFFKGNSIEYPAFSDYSGFVYTLDTGTDDYPLGVQTAISSYFWTNWKNFENMVSKKGVAQVVIYHLLTQGTLTFGYSYDFAIGIQYSSIFQMLNNPPLWGSVYWGAFYWTGTGGAVTRRDLTGRGRVVRLYIANSNMSETFRLDGLGSFVKQASAV